MVVQVSQGFSLRPVNTRLFSFRVLSSCLTLNLSALFSLSALRHCILSDKFSSRNWEDDGEMGLCVFLATSEFRLVWSGSSLVSIDLSSSDLISARSTSFRRTSSGLRLICSFSLDSSSESESSLSLVFTSLSSDSDSCYFFVWVVLACTGWTSLLCT